MLSLLFASITLFAHFETAVAPPVDDHGKVAWFQGSLAEAEAFARAEEKPLFIDVFTDPCPACRLLDAQTFSDARVVEALEDFVCVAINGTGNRELTRRFGVDLFPTLVFLNAEGLPSEKFQGFVGPRAFAKDARRIAAGKETIPALERAIADDPNDVLSRLKLARKLKPFKDSARMHRHLSAARALLGRGAGFDPKNLEQRYEIAKELLSLGDRDGYDTQVAEMKKLDPEGKSLPMRRVAFDRAMKLAADNSDEEYLLHLLQKETDREMRFEGWKRIASVYSARSQILKSRGKKDQAKDQRRFRRYSMRQAWSACPEDLTVEFGDSVARLFYDEYAETDAADKQFAIGVARKVTSVLQDDAKTLDTLACCLMAAGEKQEAIALMKRCMQLDPIKLSYRTRLEMFEAGKVHE